MVNVVAEAIPQRGISFCVRGSQNPFTIGVCITDLDGTPVTGLTQANFNVFQVAGLLTGVQVEGVETTPFVGSEGYYGVGVCPNSLWSDGHYIFGVVVSGQSPELGGHALVTLRIG
jgi:hypothetical protein